MDNSKIDKIIQNRYYKSGIAGFLKRNSPELFIILVRQIIPKHREILEYKLEIINKKDKLEELEDLLTQAEIDLKSCSAKLRFWEKEEKVSIGIGKLKFTSSNYWQIVNTAFDWILKAGLTIVPILSLVKIVGINLSTIFEYSNQPLLIYALFSAISLVWLTSATISNWVISHPNSDAPKKYELFGLFIDSNTLTLLILSGIWLAEALIGFALIPELIDRQTDLINLTLSKNQQIQRLGAIEKFEILLGVSIFAFINILFSIAKGRMYRFSTPRKQEYGKALANRERLIHTISKEEKKIGELERKIILLEDEMINPKHFEGKDYFNKTINNLSTFSMQGRDIEPNFEIVDFYEMSEDEITSEYKKDSGKEPESNSDS
jgi:hypothetical protein